MLIADRLLTSFDPNDIYLTSLSFLPIDFPAAPIHLLGMQF